MKSKIKNRMAAWWAMGLLLVAGVSCIKDKSNYDYHDVNSVEISGIDSLYRVMLGQPLRITPTLEFSVDENKDEMHYRWHVLGGNNWTSRGVISSERNLDVIVGGSLMSREATYQLLYSVTNMTTGVRYDKRFRVIVQERMQVGYIMLCERENNGFDIDLISLYNDTLTQYHNVLDAFASNLPREGRKALDMLCFRDGMSPMNGADGKEYAIWILTDKGTDRVRVEDFEWRPEYNISSISAITDQYMQGKELIAEKMFSPGTHTNQPANWMFFNGNWYWYNMPQMAYFYMKPINSATSTSEPYKVAPYIFANTLMAAIVFNEDGNRFEWQNADAYLNSDATLRTRRFATAGVFFDWENPNYRLIYLGNRTWDNGFAVVKNVSAGKYELLLMRVRDMSGVPEQLGKSEFPAGFPVEDIKFFAIHPVTTVPFLYFATEDKLYRLNFSSMIETGWVDITADVLPPGHKFSMVKNSVFRFAANNPPDNNNGSRRIVICTYDPAGEAGKNGQLALYNIEDGTGRLTLAKHPHLPTREGYQIDMKWGGFGKIINVDYKQP
jgi:hypothetical protein